MGRPRKYYAITPAGAGELRESYTTIQKMAGGLLGRVSRMAGDRK